MTCRRKDPRIAKVRLAYFALAIVVALGAILYIKAFYGAKHAFERLGWPLWLRPATGGLIVGLIALAMPWALGTSDAALQHVLTMQADAIAPERFMSEFALLAGLAVAKILATACAIGSGGVFGPAVVTGGILGAATGLAASHLFPGLGIQPGAFALVGMGGFFAAAGKTPISTIIMVSEITGNYRLLVPTMWVCMIAYVLTRRYGLYEKQLKNRLEAPAHRGEMMEAVLRQIRVRDVLAGPADPALRTVDERATLRELVARFAAIEQSSVPVVRRDGRVTGLILSRELRATLAGGQHMADAVIAADLAHPPVVVTRDDTLLTAIRRVTTHSLDEIVVVGDYSAARYIGILSRRHIVSAYYAALTATPSA